MSSEVDPAGSKYEPRPLRYDLALQRSRMVVYSIALPLVLLFRPTGFHQIDLAPAILLWVTACGTGLLFMLLSIKEVDRRLGVDLAPAWMVCDAVFISFLIHLDGGETSLWFILYLSNTAAAAFASGSRAAFVAMVTNSAAYLLVLIWSGQIVAVDHHFWWALGRLAILYGSSLYAMKGIGDLRNRRLEIRRLRAEDQRHLLELERLTTELERKNLLVEQANRLKSRFLANMSHELRTPLNSIIGFTQILETKIGDQVDPRHARFLNNVRASGQHLLALINNLLDISKIEAGHMEFHLEELDPAEIITEATDLMRGFGEQRRVSIRIEDIDNLPRVVTDSHKLEQVLINLLSNAVKHSPPGSDVVIRASSIAAEEGLLQQAGIRIDVVDYGPGIAAEHLELIFEEFRQVESEQLKPSRGTGLGLALARRFLQLQGGAIVVESELGKGSTFSALVPLHCEAPAGVVRPVLEPDEAAIRDERTTILVVEDDPNAARLLADTLREAGYAVVHAANADEALARVREFRPAVITLDLVMPGKDGWQVLGELKKDPSTRSTPVVIVSVMGDSELGFALGADDFFVKPIQPEAFLGRIRQLVDAEGDGPETQILVIDDDPAVHDIFAEHLAGTDLGLISAMDGPRGIELAGKEQPAVIVLDLMMPGMNGLEVADRLRSDPNTQAIPIVVLSAHDVSKQDRQALQGLVNDLQRKDPPWPNRLLDTITELLGRASGDRPLP